MKLSEARAMRAAILEAAKHLNDAVAATAPMLFPRWKVGEAYAGGERLCHNGKLYKVKDGMPHTSQADWTPDVAVSLYERIDAGHVGTMDDPIPYDGNMALVDGLHYVQDGVVYLCTRDTVNPVYNPLAELVGIYVKEVQKQ